MITRPNAMDHPLASVVIPTYNDADQLLIALDLVRAQSWPNIEIIVADDAHHGQDVLRLLLVDLEFVVLPRLERRQVVAVHVRRHPQFLLAPLPLRRRHLPRNNLQLTLKGLRMEAFSFATDTIQT